jgi:predicted nucleic acid-binding protein
MIVVADTSVLLNLCRVAEEDLLWQLYGTVAAPQSVRDEFERACISYPRFSRLAFPNFIQIHPPGSSLQKWLPGASLDPGESDAIALVIDLKADLLLIDERKGRQVAAELGLCFSGILGVLIQAKNRGLVSDVRTVLRRLREEAGFFLSEKHLQDALRLAGESQS